MDGSQISSVVKGSAESVLRYMEDMQWVTDPPIGMSETEAESVRVLDGFAVLCLSSRLDDTSGLLLKVGGTVLGEDEAGFTRYDEISRTIVVRPGEEVLRQMSAEGVRVSVLTDMKFLVSAVGEFFERYGGSVSVPAIPRDDVVPIFPSEPTEQQREAAATVLSNQMSYVWGAPGTGKTQFVLASCIKGCLAKGERVAVFAPTNNSVEQVLRGILASFSGSGVPEGIVRLGVPTRAFLSEHPEMCEDRQAQLRLDMCMRSSANLEEVLYERECDRIRPSIEVILGAPGDADPDDVRELRPEMSAHLDEAVKVSRLRPSTSGLFVRGVPVSSSAERLREALYDRERPAAAIAEYEGWSDSEIASRMMRLESEADALRRRSTGNRILGAPIIAGTPQQFISRFRPRGWPEDGRMELDVDRIFLDEAGYCGLVQALSLFSNGVPVGMFGDHMQLPPVTQLDESLLRDRAQSGGRMSEAFLWGMSALHCEEVLTRGLREVRSSFLSGSAPEMVRTARADLTESRRFGTALAAILDRFVYHNGMTGAGFSDMKIECVDAVCGGRDTRENVAEARAIRDLIRREGPNPADVCILSPYSAQCRLIRGMVGRRYADCVMTVHGSQGREWDTVILSVADSGSVNREVPLRFTSSSTPIGIRVINTAVSRAKRRLVVVCDRRFWSAREGELIGGLVGAAEDQSFS